jgi:very-short-patch-repair endonuclease
MQKGSRRVKLVGPGPVLIVSGTKDERIAAVAGRQRGRLSRKQLLAAGVGPGSIKSMLGTGRLHRRHAGVYAVGHTGPVELGDETAALLACGDDAVLSHWTALAIWKLLPLRPPDTVHVTLVAGRSRTQPGITVHKTSRLARQDVRMRSDLRLTSPARTLLDLAPELTNRQLERALDEALATEIVRRQQVADTVARMPGRAGASRLKALLDPGRPRTRTWNDGEERLLILLREANVPDAEANYRWNEFTFDLYWPTYRVAVELDGFPYHSTRSALARDRRKEAACEAASIDLIRVGYEQLETKPVAVVARIVRRIERARRTLRESPERERAPAPSRRRT